MFENTPNAEIYIDAFDVQLFQLIKVLVKQNIKYVKNLLQIYRTAQLEKGVIFSCACSVRKEPSLLKYSANTCRLYDNSYCNLIICVSIICVKY